MKTNVIGSTVLKLKKCVVRSTFMETYVLKNSKTGKYIGIDNASGGYPYDCDLTGAKIWTDKKQAKGYADTFPNKQLTLHKLKVEDEPCAF